jgi:hypothetical protein
MAHDTVMSTPIFDQLLREMAERADPVPATTPSPSSPPSPPSPEQDQPQLPGRRRHRAE